VDESCFGYDVGHGINNRSRGQLTSANNSSHTKTLFYNSQRLLEREEMAIATAPQTYITAYEYDAHLRPIYMVYPDGERVLTAYNSRGLPHALWSHLYGYLLDNVEYNAAGQIRYEQMMAGGNRWRSYAYYPWESSDGNSNGRLNYIGMGTAKDAANLLNAEYTYDSFGNVASYAYNGAASSAVYDAQQRLTSLFGRSYAYDAAGRFTSYEGASMVAAGSGPPHVRVPSGTSFYFDENGNFTYRPTTGQNLSWYHAGALWARLYQVSNTFLTEFYFYDTSGQRCAARRRFCKQDSEYQRSA
jgi:hypothetical protein